MDKPLARGLAQNLVLVFKANSREVDYCRKETNNDGGEK
jgi:hypothetical protein